MIFNSSVVFSENALSFDAKLRLFTPSFASITLASAKFFASFSEFKTTKSSPELDAPFIPSISTGADGRAFSIFFPLSLIIARILPHLRPLTKKSPFYKVPVVTIIVATGPLPMSILDSKTTPVAFDSKSVLRSKISA